MPVRNSFSALNGVFDRAFAPARRRAVLGSLVVLAALGTGACDKTARLLESTSSPDAGTTSEPNFSQFSDIPIPAGADMDLERSLVLGEQDSWIGRLVLAVGTNPGKTFDFYFGEMPRFGWFPITTVRAETSVLTYARADRIATIQVQGRTLTGSTVSMTISPKRQLSGARSVAPRSAPRSTPHFGSVTTAPMR